MRLSLTDSELAIQDEVRSFLAEDRPPQRRDLPRDYEERMAALRVWQGLLKEAGLVAVSWPSEYGGRGATLAEQMVVDLEMARAGAPRLPGEVGLTVVGPSLVEFGTEEQKDLYLDRLLSAEEVWCQGFSEPNAGSDLASLRTKAVDKGDHFVVSGQKTWTSHVSFARWCAVLAITDPEVPAHKGISYLIVDLGSEGIEVRPLVLTTGDAEFGEVFFEDVIVPKENVLGPLNGGWGIAMHTLSHERGPYAMTRQVQLRVALDGLIADARRAKRGGVAAIEDPELKARISHAHISLEVLKHHCYRNVGRLLAGGAPGMESSVDKQALVRVEQEVAALSLDVLGAQAELTDGASSGTSNEEWQELYLYARAGSVYGGATQIQDKIIAERLLGLPRSK